MLLKDNWWKIAVQASNLLRFAGLRLGIISNSFFLLQHECCKDNDAQDKISLLGLQLQNKAENNLLKGTCLGFHSTNEKAPSGRRILFGVSSGPVLLEESLSLQNFHTQRPAAMPINTNILNTSSSCYGSGRTSTSPGKRTSNTLFRNHPGGFHAKS